MVGDVNLFFNHQNDDEAEIEIMVAENWARKQGFGKESVALMMQYGIEKLNVKKFVAKINDDNETSLKMFKYFDFVPQAYSEVFRQHTLLCEWNLALLNRLRENFPCKCDIFTNWCFIRYSLNKLTTFILDSLR